VACLFSALVNMHGCESVMGRTESLTLVDRIHLVAVYIFAGAIATVFLRLTAEAGQAKQAMWLDPRLLCRVLTIIIVQKAIAALLPPNFRAAHSMSLVPVDYNQSQDEREAWFNDTSNHQVICTHQNSSKSKPKMRRDVGTNFKEPGE
jgi:hypothetical protein